MRTSTVARSTHSGRSVSGCDCPILGNHMDGLYDHYGRKAECPLPGSGPTVAHDPFQALGTCAYWQADGPRAA
jgi:hypothetical protein